MLISTPEELQQYLPSHSMDNIATMLGFLDNSEHDFLMERVGAPLHEFLVKAYQNICENDQISLLLATNAINYTPTQLLITLCQRVIVFDAFARSAEIRAVSVNSSGFNDPSSDGYDTSSADSVKQFKSQCIKESHAAVNRLLLRLEEWAKQSAALAEIQTPELTPEQTETNNIVDLWKRSAYYYKTEGILINTATALSEFLDIYESREKFIQLLPDLRYIQEVVLSSEFGEDLVEDLTKKNVENKGNNTEKKAIRLMKRAMALCLEDRNKMFKRELAHSEAIQAFSNAKNFISAHTPDFNPEALSTSPLAPPVAVEEDETEEKWKNNKKGTAMFVTHPIF